MLEFSDTQAAKFLDVEVVKEHSPDEDNVRWPGSHHHVHVWWEMANGYGVAWNENPSRGYSFPVVKIV
jgi:hypothetical protein